MTISLGFLYEVPSIRDAIVAAEQAKDGRILFFAAANNICLNMPEVFPALFESVISIRGTHYDESFDPNYNPAPWGHKEEIYYGTLGKDVACGWTQGCLVKSGCSVATPIMVAIAVTVIWVLACPENNFSKGAKHAIQTRRGMLSVLSVMTEDQRESKRYLAPWHLFGNDDMQLERKINSIRHALDRLPRLQNR